LQITTIRILQFPVPETKTLQGNSTVNNIVNLNTGVLQLGSNNLTVANDASNAIQGAFTSGNMIETNSSGVLIRNGTATLAYFYSRLVQVDFYAPMSITALSGGTTGTINVFTAHDGTLGSNFCKQVLGCKDHNSR